MWVWLSVCSAVLLGIYDVEKKQALKKNSVLWVLLGATALSALFLCPFLSSGPIEDHLSLVFKAVLVSSSWISGLVALKLLPLTTASTIKASRPMFVVIFSIILFGERLSLLQWAGVALVMAALLLLARSSKKEGISFTSDKGIAWMVVSVLTGAASALYDKYILGHLQPMFVQSWTNVYITIVLALLILLQYLRFRKGQAASAAAMGTAAGSGSVSASAGGSASIAVGPAGDSAAEVVSVSATAGTPADSAVGAGSSAAGTPADSAAAGAGRTGGFQKFRWDWRLVLIAVLITISDAFYFYAVKDEGALLSVISMIRRSSVVITFIFGALLFKENHIKDKAVDLAILLAGLALLLFASR